ncbi:hypothetical protein P9G49_14970, partial [Heyndrickxia coagulans]|nr:hypothetical protein [Heyndrickxia coagulans]
MDKDTFISMSPTKKVQEVNKMLQKYDLKEISKLLGILSAATFNVGCMASGSDGATVYRPPTMP